MAAATRERVPITELNPGDVIEWADSDKGQGIYWRVVTVIAVKEDRAPAPFPVFTIVVANAAGVRTCRMWRRPESEYVRTARAEAS